MDLKQYDIILVNLDPTIGSEIKKTRPCLILSPDEMNRHLLTITIAPLTTTLKQYPTRVPVSVQKKEGMIVLDQIRTIDRRRIIKRLESIKPETIQAVKDVIRITFVE